MSLEPPDDLLRRLKLGREEHVQRLLTMLILDPPYPRWNTPRPPSPRGVEFFGMLWIWQTATGGRPLTPMGADVGYELRLSWHGPKR